MYWRIAQTVYSLLYIYIYIYTLAPTQWIFNLFWEDSLCFLLDLPFLLIHSDYYDLFWEDFVWLFSVLEVYLISSKFLPD